MRRAFRGSRAFLSFEVPVAIERGSEVGKRVSSTKKVSYRPELSSIFQEELVKEFFLLIMQNQCQIFHGLGETGIL